MDRPVSVLVAAAGAGWEASVLRRLSAEEPAIVVLKRCVDLEDLLASATTGQAQVALVALGLPGLDAASTELLRRSGLGVVTVAEPGELAGDGTGRARRIGLELLVDAVTLDGLVEGIHSAAGGTTSPQGDLSPAPVGQPTAETGRMVAVWGPVGAPGRTTLAVGLAAELARHERGCLLMDVDGYGGAVAQHLGVLDEASGLLAAARAANAGQLDRDKLVALARQVDPGLRILTGLPRADRWGEVRDSAFDVLLQLARTLARHVVLDTGFSLELEPGAAFASRAPRRNAMTLTSLEQADEVVVVGSADPVGLARLARGLVELAEVVPGCTLRVAVNQARPALGWGESQVRAMIDGFVTPASVHFLPYDRAAADQALVSGTSLVELGDSALRRGMNHLASTIAGEDPPRARRRGLRRRRAGRAR